MTVMQIRPLKKHLASLSGGFHQTWTQCQWVLSARQPCIPELLNSKDIYLEAIACGCTSYLKKRYKCIYHLDDLEHFNMHDYGVSEEATRGWKNIQMLTVALQRC